MFKFRLITGKLERRKEQLTYREVSYREKIGHVTGILESGRVVQRGWRELRGGAVVVLLHPGHRAGEREERVDRAARATRTIPQDPPVLRRPMDHDQRSDVRRK